ncbi:(2Fe-2S)-binding protein [Massilia cavernae]|uniref:(2Fe-2S)-binding protein n=1 Tax=Massilia cavernae TaxID=2320864 RepID=A0A418XG02_9BURK|nr:(2Fe-2S)-binding protein [Massilia cavernae]RJG11385.1 (2Fe-2S)-binding protein [Massilia cavernae]
MRRRGSGSWRHGVRTEIPRVTVHVDGEPVSVPAGASVVAALALLDSLCTRISVGGEPRFALCGMGQCQECRVCIDGRPHQLACQAACRDGMRIDTGAAK